MRDVNRTIAATDGSCLGNPGPGGWAWVTGDGRQGWGSTAHTTNNVMELRAVADLLLVTPGETLLIQTDSEYVLKTFTERLDRWLATGRRFKNPDLILEIKALLDVRDVEWEKVEAHSGHALNDKADALALQAAKREQRSLQTGRQPPSTSTVTGGCGHSE
jgi:ribonuclease HI